MWDSNASKSTAVTLRPDAFLSYSLNRLYAVACHLRNIVAEVIKMISCQMFIILSVLSTCFSLEQLQRCSVECRCSLSRHERGRALCRQSGHHRGTHDVCHQRWLRGFLQGTGRHTHTHFKFAVEFTVQIKSNDSIKYNHLSAPYVSDIKIAFFVEKKNIISFMFTIFVPFKHDISVRWPSLISIHHKNTSHIKKSSQMDFYCRSSI